MGIHFYQGLGQLLFGHPFLTRFSINRGELISLQYSGIVHSSVNECLLCLNEDSECSETDPLKSSGSTEMDFVGTGMLPPKKYPVISVA